MLGYTDVNFKYKELYQGDVSTGFKVVKSETPKMFRVQWPDGVLSADHYNYTRAREHAVQLYLEGQNKAPRSPAGAFK